MLTNIAMHCVPMQKYLPGPGENGVLRSNLFCPVNVTSQPGGTLPDDQTMEEATNFLKKNYETDSPYFLAVGLHKPHVPHKFPEEYLQYHPYEDILLPSNYFIPPKLPSVAWNPYASLRKRDDVSDTRPIWPWGPLDENLGRRIIQGYYSATTYIDSLGDPSKLLSITH